MSAATYAVTTGTTNVYPERVGLLIVTATLSATAYSAGITLDISTILTQLAGAGTNQQSGANTQVYVQTNAINWADVYGAIGVANITTNSGGGDTNGVVKVTKTTTSGQFTVNIFTMAAGVDVAAGNLTGTITLYIFLDSHSRSYNA